MGLSLSQSLSHSLTVTKMQDQRRKITGIVLHCFDLDKFGLVKFGLVSLSLFWFGSSLAWFGLVNFQSQFQLKLQY